MKILIVVDMQEDFVNRVSVLTWRKLLFLHERDFEGLHLAALEVMKSNLIEVEYNV